MRTHLAVPLMTLILWPAAAVGLDQLGLRPPPATQTWEAAVVAGCRVMPDGEPSDCLKTRTDAAVALYAEGRVDRLVFTGGMGTHGDSEGIVAARRALAAGVDPAHITVETRSTSTLENARYAAQRLDAETIVVVTDAYHTHRAQRAFARHFEEVGSLGVRSPPRTRWKGAMREVVAIAYHILKGDL